MKILDKGLLELVASEATDLSVVNSARVSFGKRKDLIDTKDEELIWMLLSQHHGTPFEHNFFSFHIKCPIFVAREWFRHRIGSFNEFSMRYSKVSDPQFYLPAMDELRTQHGKPGAYFFEPINLSTLSAKEFNDFEDWLFGIECHQFEATRLYNEGIKLGIAREQARIVFPVSIYTEFYWSINARSLMNFLGLRNSDFALKEIRDYAIGIEKVFKEVMPITYNAFIQNERIAP